jgi:poly-gamma-glutamate synthesis protein (capsule biosynthesis protein)
LVTKEHFEALKDIAKGTHINGERDNARKIGSLPPEEENSINFGGQFFTVTDSDEGKFTYCHQGDLKRIIQEISKAKECANYVFLAIHSHQIKKESYTEPDYFLEEFSHKCIDAGADVILGGGTHQLKPIEIYKGKPIFYSLGNFVFQNHLVHRLPADFWDKYNYDEKLTVAQGMQKKTKNGTVGLELDIHNYLSVIPVIEFDKDKISDICLIPVELNFNNEELKGLPTIADESSASAIYEYLKDISTPYNTALEKLPFFIKVQI